MTIRKFENHSPVIAATAYVDESAVVIGQVSLGEESSIWPMAVVRGDVNSIKIGRYTNIQDSTIIHVNHAGEFNPRGNPTVIGDEVTVGHRVVLHGCTIENRCLIGIGSIVMDDVIIHSDVIVGAGSLVPPNKELESGYLWLGSPVKKIRPLTETELAHLKYSALHYAKLKNMHKANA